LTGNPVIDRIMTDANNAMIDTALAPSCYDVVANTWYYSPTSGG
jgi:hypothetical protein